jgi:hypothetical protein
MVEAAVMRERLFTMRLSDEESERLEAVSKHYGLNAASTIRMLVKQKHDELRTQAHSFGPAPKRARAPKK